jgi:hypothetical protein
MLALSMRDEAFYAKRVLQCVMMPHRQGRLLTRR